MRGCRKKTGPRESSLIATAISRNTGASRISPTIVSSRSRPRFDTRSSRESFGAGTSSTGIPSTSTISTLEAMISK